MRLELWPSFVEELARLTPAAMLLFDSELVPVDCNPAFLRLTGRGLAEEPLACFSEAERARVREALARRSQEPLRWPGQVRRRDDHSREVEIIVVSLEGFSLLVMLDVTDSRRLGMKLAALDRFSSAVTLSKSLDATLSLLAEQVVEATQAAASVVLLLESDRTVSRVGRAGVPAEVVEAAFELFAERPDVPALVAFQSGRTVVVSPERKREFLKGTRLGALVDAQGWTQVVCVPLRTAGQTLGVMNCFFTDSPLPTPDEVSFLETLARFAAVAVQNARLFEEAEERAVIEERQRLGRELHDSVSQSLYSIGLGAQAALAALEAGSLEEARETVGYVLSLAGAGLDDMRALLFRLRPESLEDEGLAVALRRQAEALGVRYGLEVSVEVTEPELALSGKHALYRIAAEAMHNVIKHARASRLRVFLGDGELVVEDDGEGFVVGSASGGFGLGTMRERAAQAGGTLEVSSAPGQGTRVVARL